MPGPQGQGAAEHDAWAWATHSPQATQATPHRRAHRLTWAQLLARVLHIDVTLCPQCGGHMKIVAALTDPVSIRSYLEAIGLPSRAPPVAAARPNPQPHVEFAA